MGTAKRIELVDGVLTFLGPEDESLPELRPALEVNAEIRGNALS